MVALTYSFSHDSEQFFSFLGDLGNDAMMDTAAGDSLPYGQDGAEEEHNNNSSGATGNGIIGMDASSLAGSADEGGVGVRMEDGGIGNISDSTAMASTAAAAVGDKGDNSKAVGEVDERLRKIAPVPNIPYHLQVRMKFSHVCMLKFMYRTLQCMSHGLIMYVCLYVCKDLSFKRTAMHSMAAKGTSFASLFLQMLPQIRKLFQVV